LKSVENKAGVEAKIGTSISIEIKLKQQGPDMQVCEPCCCHTIWWVSPWSLIWYHYLQ